MSAESARTIELAREIAAALCDAGQTGSEMYPRLLGGTAEAHDQTVVLHLADGQDYRLLLGWQHVVVRTRLTDESRSAQLSPLAKESPSEGRIIP